MRLGTIDRPSEEARDQNQHSERWQNTNLISIPFSGAGHWASCGEISGRWSVVLRIVETREMAIFWSLIPTWRQSTCKRGDVALRAKAGSVEFINKQIFRAYVAIR